MKWPLLSAIFPRICLIGFKFAQPFLINRVIDYVGNKPDLEGSEKNTGYGLITSTALIYIGLAVSIVACAFAVLWYSG
jgi:ATP-binding cassette, subfamily C (CFTR/MRP), member 1